MLFYSCWSKKKTIAKVIIKPFFRYTLYSWQIKKTIHYTFSIYLFHEGNSALGKFPPHRTWHVLRANVAAAACGTLSHLHEQTRSQRRDGTEFGSTNVIQPRRDDWKLSQTHVSQSEPNLCPMGNQRKTRRNALHLQIFLFGSNYISKGDKSRWFLRLFLTINIFDMLQNTS